MLPKQKMLIQKTWSQVVPIADQAAAIFYQRLFEIDPSTRTSVSPPPTWRSSARSCCRCWACAVSSLDNLGALSKTVEDLGRRHAGYGVKDSHYDLVGVALLWTLEQGLGAAWSDRSGGGLERGLWPSLQHHAQRPSTRRAPRRPRRTLV